MRKRQTEIDTYVINATDKSKSALYAANSKLIELCNSENIYLSKNDFGK